jgi:hypothetical protein
LHAATRKLVNHAPPSDADASVTGCAACDAPSGAHEPPSGGQDRTTSAETHALGNTATAATVRPGPTGPDNKRCASHPHGSHSAPTPMANSTSSGPTLVTSQYWVASTNPAAPHQPRAAPAHPDGAARTSNSSGSRPTQASHHHVGAGKASAGSAPSTDAAIRLPQGFADRDT